MHRPRAHRAQTVGLSLLTGLAWVVVPSTAPSLVLAANPVYAIADLGTFQSDYAIAFGLNATRDVVGNSQVGFGAYHAFRWRAGALTDVGTLGAGSSGIARDVNALGTVVGGADTGDGGSHAFSWSNGTMTDLGVLAGNYSEAFAINDAGDVVGDSYSSLQGYSHGVRWSGGSITDLGTLGGANSHARDINTSGQVAGDSDLGDAGDHSHAVIWDSDGTSHDLGSLDGTFSNAVGINDAGHATGRAYIGGASQQRAFYWDGASMSDLGTLGGGTFSEGEAINASEQIVGRTDSSSGQHGFLWSGGSMVNLDDLLPTGSGWRTADAFDINDDGAIAGYGYHDNHLRAFVMFPDTQATVPSAPSTVLAAAGDATASISWTAPAYDGGSSLTSYAVTASPGGASATVLAPATTANINGLSNDASYSFTVIAANAIGPGPASAPSNAVTPVTGTPPPQSVADTVPPEGGSVSSGSGTPTSADPVVTNIDVPQTPSGGAVAIAESAIDETAPSGFLFIGQQVNIDSNVPTTAFNPLRITFDIDVSGQQPPPDPAGVTIYRTEGTGSPTPIADCANPGTTADPDPCVASRGPGSGSSDIVLVVLTSRASHWNLAVTTGVQIRVTDAGFDPRTATIPLGTSAIWSFVGARPHSTTDASKLGPASAPLFDSGARLSGSYAFEFWNAGSYAYRSTPRGDSKGFAGTLLVPLTVSPSLGTTSTTYTITWGSRSVAGYASDIQYRFKAKGAKTFGKWIAWRTGATGVSDTFVSTRLGSYEFEARLRNNGSGHASGWSPATGMIVQ